MFRSTNINWIPMAIYIVIVVLGNTLPKSNKPDPLWEMFDIIHGRQASDEFLRPQVPRKQQKKESTDNIPGLEEWSYPSETMEEIEIID